MKIHFELQYTFVKVFFTHEKLCLNPSSVSSARSLDIEFITIYNVSFLLQ